MQKRKRGMKEEGRRMKESDRGYRFFLLSWFHDSFVFAADQARTPAVTESAVIDRPLQ